MAATHNRNQITINTVAVCNGADNEALAYLRDTSPQLIGTHSQSARQTCEAPPQSFLAKNATIAQPTESHVHTCTHINQRKKGKWAAIVLCSTMLGGALHTRAGVCWGREESNFLWRRTLLSAAPDRSNLRAASLSASPKPSSPPI